MMDYPLLVPRLLERANTFFPDKEIITRESEVEHRYTYRDLTGRVARLSNALRGLGVREGDRVGTFGWNTYRHLEAYFAPPVMGAMVHTINIRLAPDDLVYIINHAGDKVILVDPGPGAAAGSGGAPAGDGGAFRGDDRGTGNFPPPCPPPRTTRTYWPPPPPSTGQWTWDENAPAGLCYTSATTGRPKGVVYSHRGIYLHSMAVSQADTIGIRERDVIMAMVPMFHANCWGTPYSATMVGASQVFTGVRPDAEVICRLIDRHRVTLSLGVPTIWVAMLDYVERSSEKYDFSSVREVVSGGSAVPVSLIEAYKERLGIDMIHAYGMTESAPIVAYNRRARELDGLSGADKLQLAAQQGRGGLRAGDEVGRRRWPGPALGRREQGRVALQRPLDRQ